MFHRLAVRALSSSAGGVATRAFNRRSAAMARTAMQRTTLPALSSSWMFSTQASASQDAISHPDMFCRQCEQTNDHVACTTVGVCGKSAETSAVQDTLMYQLQSVAVWAVAARAAGASAEELQATNVWTVEAAFSTMTNVNFSEDRICDYIREGAQLQHELQHLVAVKNKAMAPTDRIALLDLSQYSNEELEEFGHSVGVPERSKQMNNKDCFALQELATYGVKGACAYAAHCYQLLGTTNENVMRGIHQVFAQIASNEADMEGLFETSMKVGELNGTIMGMLDDAHATTFGEPAPYQVKMSATAGKCILVSGHDLKDLKALLEQTEGTGVNVYTHGEMLPAHSYPELNKYPHLVGNYGTAWQNQKFEFAGFPGPIIVTTNCIVAPRRIYQDRMYTMNQVGVDGVKHIGPDRDFSQVIEQAQQCKGFPKTIDPPDYHTVGFNHRVVLPLAGQVIEAAKSGALSRIVLIGGCDGSQWDRNYFTDLAEGLPADTLILTMGCAKNRIIHSKKLMGQTLSNGMPRVMDMGQCNDSYSAVVVATELAKALDCTVNELPLSLAVSHLEQKAAAVLLTLLNMGIKNIRLGPSLPAYLTPDVLDILVQKYNLMPTGNVQEDVKNIMAGN